MSFVKTWILVHMQKELISDLKRFVKEMRRVIE
jgi:hypothetical protein